MEKAVPDYPMFKKAIAAKVKMPMGTDAVAGAMARTRGRSSRA
jgi:hypothetical protein